MPDPVRVAVFGNSFAARAQLPALRWAGGNEVVGIAGHDEGKARETARAWGIPRWTTDYRELLEPAPDLVLVTTPVDLHHEMTLAALDAGAAVLCEKPFAMNVAEAEEMCRRAQGRGAWIDHELRWSPMLRVLRERARDGSMGTPMHASWSMQLGPRFFLERAHGWWFQAERGGGVLGAIGSHLIDLARWTLGEIEAVRATLRTFRTERADVRGEPRAVTADEFAALELRFANGWFAEIHTSVALPSENVFRIQLTGSRRSYRLVDDRGIVGGELGGELVPVPVEVELPKPEETGMPDAGPFSLCLPHFLVDVLAAVREGRTEVPEAATFEDGLATQRVLDAARRSANGAGGWEVCG